jgi:ligand-binding SRPBCC domain-containing protein
MKVLQFEQRVPKKVSEIFPFFCDEKNLELLTPPWLQFAILKKIHHISCFWQSRIESWQPNLQFVDVQTKGPYAIWHHTHQFKDENGITIISDTIRYSLYGGRLTELFIGGWIRRDIEKIFNYRQKIITEIFGAV